MRKLTSTQQYKFRDVYSSVKINKLRVLILKIRLIQFSILHVFIVVAAQLKIEEN